MKIVRAKILGFCAGVRRAVLAAEKALEEHDGSEVFSLGPLIHNPVALEKLSSRNLKVISEDEISRLRGGETVIIRAHGVPPETENSIRNKGVNVVNATCPLVTKSQRTASDYAEKGYVIFFAGDKNHGEVIGIEGYARQGAEKSGKALNFILVKDVDELKSSIAELQAQNIISDGAKIILLSQTTFSISMFDSLQKELKRVFPEAEVVSSICPATYERQSSLVDLCSQVDGVIVIGGRNSANTNRLFNTARSLSAASVLIEKPEEIPAEFFSLETVGITAGASTPDDIIQAVEKLLLQQKDAS